MCAMGSHERAVESAALCCTREASFTGQFEKVKCLSVRGRRMTEMEYRSAFASLLPHRYEINMARNWDSSWPVVLVMRFLEGTEQDMAWKTTEGLVRFKEVEVDG